MKTVKFYIIACTLIACAGSLAVALQNPTQESSYETPQCYCSDLCGPRDVKPSDAPFVDPETGICFCKQRDKDNYMPHQCNIKNPQVDFPNKFCKD